MMGKLIDLSTTKARRFRRTIYDHYRHFGRELPWRLTRNPYFILVSEIMLQQTQVDRVIPKYTAFIAAFPTPQRLAEATVKDVLTRWHGLGYNRRALALRKSAQIVMEELNGQVPDIIETLDRLPGVGYNTACAVAAFAFNKPVVFIETNIRSVFIHFFFADKENITDAELLPLVEATLDRAHPRQWYWALMDYGSFLKKQRSNPSRKSAHYTKQSPFLTSNRRIRGLILRQLITAGASSAAALSRALTVKPDLIQKNVSQLEKEGFITKSGRTFSLAH